MTVLVVVLVYTALWWAWNEWVFAKFSHKVFKLRTKLSRLISSEKIRKGSREFEYLDKLFSDAMESSHYVAMFPLFVASKHLKKDVRKKIKEREDAVKKMFSDREDAKELWENYEQVLSKYMWYYGKLFSLLYLAVVFFRRRRSVGDRNPMMQISLFHPETFNRKAELISTLSTFNRKARQVNPDVKQCAENFTVMAERDNEWMTTCEEISRWQMGTNCGQAENASFSSTDSIPQGHESNTVPLLSVQ